MKTTKKLLLFALSATLFGSCSTDLNDPEGYAKKYCSCSVQYADAISKNKNNQIKADQYNEIVIEHIKCMGSFDPRQEMTPEEINSFDTLSTRAIWKRCPDIAKKIGLNEYK